DHHLARSPMLHARQGARIHELPGSGLAKIKNCCTLEHRYECLVLPPRNVYTPLGRFLLSHWVTTSGCAYSPGRSPPIAACPLGYRSAFPYKYPNPPGRFDGAPPFTSRHPLIHKIARGRYLVHTCEVIGQHLG